MPRTLSTSLALAACLTSAPVLADVKAGVDAWGRGDFPAAVAEWQGPAQAGDADAMFNLAQAYRLGRGVIQDDRRAELLYARAAKAGHVLAADTYGLMLFQNGRQKEALPYIQDAARRGDPRSQYLLGVALFNGDWLPRDWVKAYALVSLARSQGLPQAGQALDEMDGQIPLEQRQQAASLAQQLRLQADVARKAQFASDDLEVRDNRMASTPMPIADDAVSDLVEARRATGAESPAEAGARFVRPTSVVGRTGVSTVSAPVKASAPSQIKAAALAMPKAVHSVAADPGAAGNWAIQLGAFSIAANAPKLWDQLKARPEIVGRQRRLIASGSLTRLLAAGYPTQASAQAACRSLQAAGHACLVMPR